MHPSAQAEDLLLPEALLAQGISLRQKTAADAGFLERLFVETRMDEIGVMLLPEEARLGFLRSQFALQSHHYATYYADAAFIIIEQRGEAIGRLYLHRGLQEWRIVDISLLAARRGAGLGGEVVRAVVAAAKAADRIVSLHVDQFNRARTLYERIGFQAKEERPPYLLMEWAP